VARFQLLLILCDHSDMLSKAFNGRVKKNRLIRLVLVFALVFATAHVALHDPDESGGGLDGYGDCRVCRLNHVPVVTLAEPSVFVPLQFLVSVLLVADFKYQLSHPFHTQWARAPPLI